MQPISRPNLAPGLSSSLEQLGKKVPPGAGSGSEPTFHYAGRNWVRDGLVHVPTTIHVDCLPRNIAV